MRAVSPSAEKTRCEKNHVWHSLALRTAGIQPKLSVSQPGDESEREAERVADKVMESATPVSVPESTGTVQVQRQQPGNTGQSQPTPNLLKIYSFGPTGAGRVARDSGTTIFEPRAPVDANDRELVRAGTQAQPILSRLGRWFTVDERQRPLTPPVPDSRIVAEMTWTADDQSQSWRTIQPVTGTYYAPGEPLGSSLGSEYILRNDRPGVLYLGYFLNNPTAPSWITLIHHVHYVNDPAASAGATVLPDHPGAPPPGAPPPGTPPPGGNPQ